LLLFLATSFVCTLTKVQTKLGNYASEFLRERYDVQISIKKIDLSYLGYLKLEGILIKDHHDAVMISSEKLETSLLSWRALLKNKLDLGKVNLGAASFNLKTYKGEFKTNLAYFYDRLLVRVQKKKNPFVLHSSWIVLRGVDFKIVNENKGGNSLVAEYKQIKGNLFDFELDGPKVVAKLRDLSFKENHGLAFVSSRTDFAYTLSRMQFSNTVLKTNNSSLKAAIVFDYNRKGLRKFKDSVFIKANFKDSYLHAEDMKKVYSEFSGKETYFLDTQFEGSINDFKLLNFDLSSNENFVLKGNYHLWNVTKADRSFVLKGVTNTFASHYKELKKMLPNIVGQRLPPAFQKIGNFSMEGATSIAKDTIDLDVRVLSDLGTVATQLRLNNAYKLDDASYEGTISFNEVDLGVILNDPLVGNISLKGNVKGRGFSLAKVNTVFNGNVTKHQYKGYTYRKIDVNGVFKNKQFGGSLKVRDENLQMDFQGLADFSSKTNKFDFKAKVAHANFNPLNLFKRDNIAILRGDIAMALEGNTIDNLRGEAVFKNASYTNQNKEYEFQDFKVKSTQKDSVKTIEFDSKDIVKGRIKGVYKLSEIKNLFQNVLGSMLSNYKSSKVTKNQFFDFDFNIYKEIVEVFLPDIRLGANTKIRGKVIDANNEIKMLFQTPKMAIYNAILDTVYLQIDNKNPVLNTNFKIQKVRMKNYVLNDINLLNKTLNDTLFVRTDFTGGEEDKERYDLSFFYTLDQYDKAVIGIKKSKIYFKDEDWFVNPTDNAKNKLIFNYSKQRYQFEEFDLSQGTQKITFSGVLKDSTYKDLKIQFQKVSLDAITPKIDSLSLKGVVNGDLNFKQKKGIYQPFGTLSVEDFSINDASQGDLNMRLKAEDSYKEYLVEMDLISDSYKNLSAVGGVDLNPRIPQIDLNVQLDSFQLNAFSPLGKNVLTKIRGVADGSFRVSGPLSNPDMDGALYLRNSGLKFPYLNVDYNFVNSPKVQLEKQSFVFDDVKLSDSKLNTTGFMNGTIQHSGFKNWRLDLKIDSDKLLVLDTKDDENKSYYGTGLIAGQASFFGPSNDLNIDVKAKTLEGTKFIIPLSDVKGVENSSLIHFKKIKKIEEEDLFLDKAGLLEKIQGLSLSFDLDVTKDAVAEVVIDKVSGSSLEGNGSGNILVEIDTKGEFKMFADFLVEKGVYNFIYGGVINKPFQVAKGGVVSWDGDPYNAELNITALHRVKANPKILLESLNTNRKIDIDLITKIRGKLFNSSNEFDIVIPNSSSVVASELDFKLNDNDDNAKMRQFFSLLISKSFFNENNIEENGSSAISGTTSDIISGALSDIFNREGDKFQIDLGYTAGEKNDIETQSIDDQVDISMATQINNRVLINGKLGVPVGTKTQSSVVGEVKVEVLVDEQGNLRWTFFNRQNEIQYSEEEEGYTQGVGLTYQIDFDNLTEMLEKLKRKKKSKQKK
jgi:hypothetical protein